MARVALLGTLDTKGEEYGYLRERLLEHGCDVLVIDGGVLGTPQITCDISRNVVANAAGTSIENLVKANDRGASIDAMARGASTIVSQLHAKGEIHAILGLGGSNGATLVSRAMQALPIGVPKILVSTIGSGDTRPYVRSSDIALMYSVVDIAGINQISAIVLRNAAAGIAGMAKGYAVKAKSEIAKPLIAATMFGVTTPCVTVARQLLESRGYEVLVFHATGIGGESMEALIEGGFFAGVLDVTTTELADLIAGGVCSAGPRRLEAAGAIGIPQVVSLGALDMVNFGPRKTVPTQFQGRLLYEHNANVTLMRTSENECAELGRMIAEKLNRAKGPVSMFVPLKGFSMISAPGGVFSDTAADRALVQSLESVLSPKVELIKEDVVINDERFAIAMARRLDEYIRSSSQMTQSPIV